MTKQAPPNLYDLLHQIKQRLGMYVEPQTLPALCNFIQGYQLALFTHDIDETVLFDKRFADFVADKYGFFESTAGYSNMVLAVAVGFDPKHIHWRAFLERHISGDEHQRALDMFFDLLDDYQAQSVLSR